MSQRASIHVKVLNRLGLHARPAMSLVDAASACKSTILIRKGGQEVDGKSIMQVLMLGAIKGAELEIIAEGADAEAAVKTLSELFQSRFGED